MTTTTHQVLRLSASCVFALCILFAVAASHAVAALPVVKQAPPEPITGTSATLNGTVATDSPLTDCQFEYVDPIEAKGDTTFTHPAVQSAACEQSPGSIPADSSPHPVSLTVALPEPRAPYYYRVVATNAEGTKAGSFWRAFGFGAPIFDGEVVDRFGEAETQAGVRPFIAATEFTITTSVGEFGDLTTTEGLQDAIVEAPSGLVANPQNVPQCKEFMLATTGCPPEAQVGRVNVTAGGGGFFKILFNVGLYNMEPTFGTPSVFGFNIYGNVTHVVASLRTETDYGPTVNVTNNPEAFNIQGSKITLWGVPADPDHTSERFFASASPFPKAGAPTTSPLSPYISMPTSCTGAVRTDLTLTSWANGKAHNSFLSHAPGEPENLIGGTGCNAVPFEPEIEARPTTNVADSATGLDVKLTVPQNEDCAGGADEEEELEEELDVVCEVATAHVKDVEVTLPKGLTINPAGANGLDGCSEGEFGVKDDNPSNCPDASRVADVTVRTPLLDHPMPGSVYLADPFDNPFDSLLAIYLEVDDEETGIIVKLEGEVEIGSDGQLSSSFKGNPQLPFEEFELNFFGGSTAPFKTPPTCGNYSSKATLVPWTAPEGESKSATDTWAIQRAPGGGDCPRSESGRSFAASLDAGTVTPVAGIDSPFVMHLRREDGTQNLKAVNLSPPPGLLAKLAGTQICPDAFLAAAESKDGRDEEDSPSCPATSRLGRIVAGAGAGPGPYYAPGTAYLAGPYKGAPLSIAVITPATAGPFDLGTIVVRIAAYIDPSTARITAISDPLPESLEGIPLNVRTLDLALDKPQFTRNPTSCDPMAVDGLVASTLGALAPITTRFQVGECGRLGFEPKVFLRLFGKRFTRGANPRLRAVVMPRPGDANIGFSSVKMPRSLFLDQSHIRTVCTRVQFAAGACPPGSVYGSAVATSPLVDYPLTGNVYLRSSNNKLPDLVADLRGPAHQPIRVEVVGKTDSVKGALRNTFQVVPDAPVTKFVLNLQAGKKSLLVASRNLCKGAQRATVKMGGQNGRQVILSPKIRIPCKKQRKRGKAKRRNKAAISRASARP